MIDTASLSPEIKREALEISGAILRDIEESEVPLSNTALKAKRLARILNDIDYIKIFEHEVSGYPTTKKGVDPEVWKLAVIAGWIYREKDEKTGKEVEYAYIESLKELEDEKAERESRTWAFTRRSDIVDIAFAALG
jgi:hypothetical protein